MSTDPDSRNDEDLLSQIDELRARMDRLMSGGTSTSNSALLTGKPEAKAAAEAPVAPPPGPDRTRIRDLIDNEDIEVIESYPGPKETVPFPENEVTTEELPAAPPGPEPPDRTRPAGGSVIPMEDGWKQVRPRVSTFTDLGSAIQQELAKDASVPPFETKKGPDLASRFGPAYESAPPADGEEPSVEAVLLVEEELVDEPEAGVEAIEEPVEFVDSRGNLGKVAAIWVITAVAAGAITALHFVGVI